MDWRQEMMDLNAVYVLWLREMKRFTRARSRVIGILVMPLFFLLGLGLGLGGLVGHVGGGTYLQFIVPGIIGMSLMSTAIASGFSVIWDREFGFLKEIMVTPNSMASIAFGRMLGGTTTAMLSATMVTVISVLIGFHIHYAPMALVSIIFMVLVAMTFISLGLILASVITDLQGFGMITSFFTMPLLFLSNGLFPLSQFPRIVQDIAYVNPLNYGIDGIRGALGGASAFPLAVDLVAMLLFVAAMASIAIYAFSKSETGV
jgi:ABC-2 type transport system permease protein